MQRGRLEAAMRVRTISFGRLLSMASGLLLFAHAQVAHGQELRNISNQFKTEPGCPVDLISAKTELEIDSFGQAAACRIYIDYKNASAKQISAVKFRFGYIDDQEHIRRTFAGDDSRGAVPDGKGHQQWRVGVDPKASYVVIRPIAVKFADGTVWQSEKFKNPLANPQAAADDSSPEAGATEPGARASESDGKQSESSLNHDKKSSSGATTSGTDPAETQ